MRTLDREALDKGMFYKLDPINHTFEPLYVRTLDDIGRVLREDFPNDRFQIIDLRDLKELYRLRERRADIAVHESNGDRHPAYGYSDSDKTENSKAWGKDDDEMRTKIEALALRCGFTEVSWPGLYPSFKDQAGFEVIEP